jgi:hypothetical protein
VVILRHRCQRFDVSDGEQVSPWREHPVNATMACLRNSSSALVSNQSQVRTVRFNCAKPYGSDLDCCCHDDDELVGDDELVTRNENH